MGSTNLLVSGQNMRGTDTAFDPKNNVYLVVGANGNAWGAFTDTSGALVGSPFRIDSGGGYYCHFPRVAYSPDVTDGAGGTGGFLVTWTQDRADTVVYVHARLVAYPARGPVASETVVSADARPGANWEVEGAPALAYSRTSRQFLVAWAGWNGGWAVKCRLVDVNGQPWGSPVQVSNGYGRAPGVAWNANTDEFGVSFCGEDSVAATAVMARVDRSGTLLRRNVFDHAGGMFTSDVAFNPVTGRYVMVYYASGAGTKGAEFDATGEALATGLVSTATGTYDGMAVSYHPTSGTFLLVGQGWADGEVHAAELNQRGARFSGDSTVTSTGGTGSFHPRATPNTNARQWNASFAFQFTAMRDQIVATTTTGGGSTSGLGPAPSSTSTGGTSSSGGTSSGGSTSSGSSATSGGCTTADPFASMGGGTCVNGGWLPPGLGGSAGSSSGSTGGTPSGSTGGTSSGTGTSSGSSAGCTTVAPGSGWTCVNGGWLPPDYSSCPTVAPGSGWTCYNGGWLPPGYPIPAGSTSGTSSGSSTSSSSSGCTGPDPFAAIGGGVCIGGGWRPKNM